MFARDGHKYYSALASAVRMLWLYQSEFKRFGNTTPIRPDEAHAVLEANPKLPTATELAFKFYAESKIIAPGILAFLIHECGREHWSKSEKFWRSAITGEELVRGTPAHLLHKRLVNNTSSVSKLSTLCVAAFGAKAWNAHVTKKPVGVLRWTDSEDFPRICS